MATKAQEYLRLKDFLMQSGVSYHRYRRMRLRGLTPPEIRLGPRTVILERKHLATWLQAASWQLKQQQSQ